MKRKSQSIKSSSESYYLDENIKRPKQEIRKRSPQKSSEVKERNKAVHAGIQAQEKNADSMQWLKRYQVWKMEFLDRKCIYLSLNFSVGRYFAMITKQKAFNKSLVDQNTQLIFMDEAREAFGSRWTEILDPRGTYSTWSEIQKLSSTSNSVFHVYHLSNRNGFWRRTQCGQECSSAQIVF